MWLFVQTDWPPAGERDAARRSLRRSCGCSGIVSGEAPIAHHAAFSAPGPGIVATPDWRGSRPPKERCTFTSYRHTSTHIADTDTATAFFRPRRPPDLQFATDRRRGRNPCAIGRALSSLGPAGRQGNESAYALSSDPYFLRGVCLFVHRRNV
jgi:hypothetical protein